MALADLLVVDDTPASLQLLASVLKERGYKVRPAPNGKLALQAARHTPPDLILLDIAMPDMSGFEVADELKKDPTLREIPIIFLSVLGETPEKLRGFAVGGVDYITKPFQTDEVVVRVNTHLKIRRLQLELEAQSRSLQRANDELRQMQQLRDDLTNMIVHDLRSPLTAVVGNLDLLNLTEITLSTDGIQCLADARAASARITAMVSSLLDISKLEAGQLEPHRTEVDVVALARETFRGVESQRDGRHFEVDAPSHAVRLSADRDLLARTLQNLVDNALKFTPRDGTVRIGIRPLSASVRITVSDTGRGIAPEYHARIFEKFGQVSRDGPRIGTGLGLTFCKLAVEAHLGRIGVDSEVGKGSTFWFELPVST